MLVSFSIGRHAAVTHSSQCRQKTEPEYRLRSTFNVRIDVDALFSLCPGCDCDTVYTENAEKPTAHVHYENPVCTQHTDETNWHTVSPANVFAVWPFSSFFSAGLVRSLGGEYFFFYLTFNQIDFLSSCRLLNVS